MEKNDFGQELGVLIPNWQPKLAPEKILHTGKSVILEPLDLKRHSSDLFSSLCLRQNDLSWTYLPYGPFFTEREFTTWAQKLLTLPDALPFAIINPKNERAFGICAYTRINPEHGSVEIAHINYSADLKKSRMATEAMYLMADYALSTLLYRRYEWKCNTLNLPSRAAAQRLGFTFEGIFRNCNVYKGHNRDTAWFSILDSEWPGIKNRLERWLEPSNFTIEGLQKIRLANI